MLPEAFLGYLSKRVLQRSVSGAIYSKVAVFDDNVHAAILKVVYTFSILIICLFPHSYIWYYMRSEILALFLL